jgi:MipA family protein
MIGCSPFAARFAPRAGVARLALCLLLGAAGVQAEPGNQVEPGVQAKEPPASGSLPLAGDAAPTARADSEYTAASLQPTGRPLWELGIGIAPITFPQYPGAREHRSYVLPMPYVIYRGERLRADRGGARGLLVNSERFELDFSADGTTPVDSTDGGPRDGMDNLDPIFEAGPSLNMRLYDGPAGNWELRLPLRAAIATSGRSLSHEGWRFVPVVNYSNAARADAWRVGFSVGPGFANRGYHGYYYDVGALDATSERAVYRADAGYSGLFLTSSLSRRFDRFWVGGFLRYQSLHGTAFADSPLVERQHSVTAGLGVTWIAWTSSELVQVEVRDDR